MSTMKASRTGLALCGVLHLPKIYKKDTNSMSASEIETNETLVSADTDLTKLSAEELIAVVAELRQENKVLKKSKDKVGLTFKRVPEDGNDSIVRLEDNQFPFLTKVESLSVTKPGVTDGNIALIEGENLAVLATLQMTHKEKVDVIYIDPPYNTGNDDFIYEDKRMYKSDEADLENLEETLDGKARTVGKDDPFRHSKWLSFMERRLFLAKELLKDTGVILLSIDDNEQARIKLLMDSVFGAENFVANVIWQSKSGGANDVSTIATTTEYIIVYAVNAKAVKFNKLKDTNSEKYKLQDSHFSSRGGFVLDKLDRRMQSSHYSASLSYPITCPDGTILWPGGEDFESEENWNWRWSEKKLMWGFENDFLEFKKNKNNKWTIHSKQYQYVDNNGDPIARAYAYRNLILSNEHNSTRGNKEILSILGSHKFDYPKPTSLIKHLLTVVTTENSTVLDFFAGSGTTGHAVAELNKNDGGNRSVILVTNNEGGIARNVTRERLARVLTGENWADGKEHEALPGNLSYYRLDFKKLSANPLSTAQMMESKFDGLLSLENNALTVVENDPDEDYAIYRNSGKVVFVWKNLFSLYDGECEELLESLKSSVQADEFIAYVPSDSLDAGITVDGWKIIPFPHDYINRYEAMIATMRRNKTLPNSK